MTVMLSSGVSLIALQHNTANEMSYMVQCQTCFCARCSSCICQSDRSESGGKTGMNLRLGTIYSAAYI